MDAIYHSFLNAQQEAGLALAGSSDLVELLPQRTEASSRYIARFLCKTMLRTSAGAVEPGVGPVDVGIWFPPDYLRRAEPFQVVTVLNPENVWHPNVRKPFICIGHLAPGTSLVDLIYQTFEVLTFHKVTPREDDCLNAEACAWARARLDEFPVDRRPLKRRALDLRVEEVAR